jgi:hypothetical protein
MLNSPEANYRVSMSKTRKARNNTNQKKIIIKTRELNNVMK